LLCSSKLMKKKKKKKEERLNKYLGEDKKVKENWS
jgi:hypothetical protein